MFYGVGPNSGATAAVIPLLCPARHAVPMGIRLRFALLYGSMTLLSGMVLLVIVGGVSIGNTRPVPGPSELQRQLAESDDARSQRVMMGLMVAFLVLLVVSVLLGRTAADEALRPLQRITAATRRISADNLHERLAVSGPADEVKVLADTIDQLLERLELSFAAQRRFVADASHELRTPLATIRAALDVAEAKPGAVPASTVRLAGRVRTSLDEMDRLLEGLLLLARSQHGALDDRTEVSLTELTFDALRAHPTDLPVYAGLDADVVVRGSPVLLARLVGNVIDNAVRHNTTDGWIQVSVTASPAHARLTVESTGPVLDPAQVAGLGRPFRRLGAERTGEGSGLGLSIVAAVTTAHGGSLSLTARPGGGLAVSVSLPVGEPPPVGVRPPVGEAPSAGEASLVGVRPPVGEASSNRGPLAVGETRRASGVGPE